ncbi:lipoyl-dependent peroxiredoxin [Entomortierella parvispora]|uniref:Lipoyl-dependent peroxiredoxin n=1 Tax=Entomortierella parvispora TaxID=205924 RepID=A0A9P3HI55_9FUNG|nr:lipoyl-dependent peroxiredoxin [Entomortierella parvispora]
MSLLQSAIRPAARLRFAAPVATMAVRQLSFKPIYTAESTVKGARNGHLTTKSGSLDLHLNMPKEFGTKGGPGTNPEELLGGGYAACFGGALGVAANELKLKLGADTTITSLVSIGPKPKGFQLAVELRVAKTGLEGADFDKAVKLAHEICPFTHALKDNIPITTTKI